MSYTASDIEVLSGLEPVRRRPGMYTDTTRPNHLAHEVIDNSVDEALAGHCKEIDVTLYKDGSLEVADDGRGMPVDIHPKEKVQRRRADPHAPARGRQVLRQELPVLRRPARRRRLGRQRAVEEPRVLGAARRQGIQHQLQRRQGRTRSSRSSARSASATPARRCASGRIRSTSTSPKFSRAAAEARAAAPRRCCARACASRFDGREDRARRTSGTTPAGSRSICVEELGKGEWLPDRAVHRQASRASSEAVDWAVVWRRDARGRRRARATST